MKLLTDCPHEHVIEDATGGWHFNGEPWDDIHIRLVCLDCGEEIPEKETETVTYEDDEEYLPF